MDNNVSETNLGSVVNEPVFGGQVEIQPPIFNSSDYITNVHSEQVQDIVQDDLESIKEEEVVIQHPINAEPKLVSGDIIIPTSLLKSMVLQARKVGVASNINPVSEVLNLIINENGIIVRSSSGIGKPDYECIDRTYSFDKKISVGLDITRFSQYLSTERNKELLIDYIADKNVLLVKTATGTRKFAQRMNEGTGLPIENKIHIPFDYNNMKPLNYERFKKLLSVNSSVRDFTKNISSNFQYLQYMYWGDDIVVATDGTTMMIQPNDSGFNDKIFCIDHDFCKLLSELTFDSSSFRVGVTEVNGEVVGITFSDGSVTICGNISLQPKFPVEPSKAYWKLDGDGIYKVGVSKSDFLYAIRSVMPSIPSIGAYVDKLAISITSDELIVKSLDDSATECIGINNSKGYVTSKPILLSAYKLNKIINSLNFDTFEFIIDSSSSNYIIFGCDSFRCIMTTLVNDNG